MQQLSPLDHGGWAEIVGQLSSDIDLSATARATKALVRARGVRDASSLLRLAMAYGVGGLSLRTTAAWAGTAGVAQLSDVSLLDRLRNAADWMESLWQTKLVRMVRPVPMPGLDLAVRLIDATTVSSPRTPTAEWRLHMDYRPFEGRFGGAVLTDGRQSEGFHRFSAVDGELVVGDRGYAKAAGLGTVRRSGGHFLVRIGWRSVVLLDTEGNDLDLLETIATLPPGRITTLTVQLADGARHRRPVCQARLILAPLPEGAGQRARARAAYKAKRQGRGILPQGAIAANWLMLLTSVIDEECATSAQMVDLYRLRWQIELAFKRLKSQLHMDNLPAKDPRLARSWLAANLLAALLTDDPPGAADSPPCGPR
jgi:hypothetical protein